MRGVDDYSDDELQRLLQKSVGTVGAKDRVEAIRAALASRSVSEDGRASSLAKMMQDDAGDDQAATLS
jgi:hypothetical protein